MVTQLSKLDFVRDEIKQLPGFGTKPPRMTSVRSFLGRIGYAASLGFKEKEIFAFALMQWMVIGVVYYLWVQVLDWIPPEVWQAVAEDEDDLGGTLVNIVLLAWSFACVGLAAYPIGVLSGCMGAVHFLHSQGQVSTIARCLALVLPQSWPIWAFHWIDGWITVVRILDRLPKKNDTESAASKALSEALYYAWKVGISGILPSLVTGNGLIQSGKNSIIFVKDNLAAVVGLRVGYSALCWIVGIAAYAGYILMLAFGDIIPLDDPIHGYIYQFYIWAGLPLIVSVGIVMVILRPIYLIALCDLYSEHLKKQGETITLPESPGKATSALVLFLFLSLGIAVVMLYRDELGISAMLSTY